MASAKQVNQNAEAPPRASVLLVDDTPSNLEVLRGILGEQYQLKAALSGERALSIAEGPVPPDLILLDVMMPEMNGYEVCRRLKANPRTRRIPVIFVTAMGEVEDEANGFAVGGVDYITKPVSPPIVLARVRTQLALYDQERHLASLVAQRTREVEETRLQIIRRLGRAAEYRDDETGTHVIRMSQFARLIALDLGWGDRQAELLLNAAPMHDVGKIGIPDRILQKPGALDEDEWKIMRQHSAIGASIIGKHDNELLETARVIALTHHEKWDGSGYPRGLKGEQIPIVGRIVALCDVFDALTSQRPYKPAWTNEKAVAYIREQSGKHFDPYVVESFLRVLPQIVEVQETTFEIVGAG
ncbi:MAG TPA: two-component system response regulator [Fontimonas sp.]